MNIHTTNKCKILLEANKTTVEQKQTATNAKVIKVKAIIINNMHNITNLSVKCHLNLKSINNL